MNTNIALSYFNIVFMQDISELYFTQITGNMPDPEITILEDDGAAHLGFLTQKKQAFDFLSHPVIMGEINQKASETGEITFLPENTDI